MRFICFWICKKIFICSKVTVENYLLSKKLNSFFRKYFSENIFDKSKISIFRKIIFRSKIFHRNFRWKFFDRKNIFRKIEFFHFSKIFFEKWFSENRVEFFWLQKVFGCNFWTNEYFFTNPKAYEQAWPWLSFPLLDIKNGPLRKKLSRFFVGVTV